MVGKLGPSYIKGLSPRGYLSDLTTWRWLPRASSARKHVEGVTPG